MMRYGSWRMMDTAVLALVAQIRPSEIVGVVGVPRSGMIAAAKLATHLGVPLASIDYFERHQCFYKSGARAKNREITSGRVLLVEDSATRCASINHACRRLRTEATHERPFRYLDYEILPAVLFGADEMPSKPHLLGGMLPHPRFFAWNWLDSWITKETLFDFDGVLCRDPTIYDDDFLPYERHIAELPPMYIPRRPILGVATYRLERFRETTSRWLQEHGVKVSGQIAMYPAKSAQERRTNEKPYGTWKGKVYKAMEAAKLFVESDRGQAERIRATSGKPVLWPEGDVLFA